MPEILLKFPTVHCVKIEHQISHLADDSSWGNFQVRTEVAAGFGRDSLVFYM